MPDNPLVNMLPTVEDEQNRFLPGSPLYKRAGRKNVATEMDGPSESLVSTDNMLRYRDTIDSVFTGALPTGSDIVLGKTPPILTEYGAPELDLHMKQSVARKIAYPSGYMGGKHNLGLSALKNLPYQLADPIAIIENPQSNSRGLASKIVLTEWTDMDGKPVIVPIHLNAQGAIDVQNEVASAFGADYIRRIIGDNGENVLYTKNNEDIEQLLSKGRPVPQAMADDVLARNSIPNTLHDVNQQYSPENSIENGSVGGGSVGAARKGFDPYSAFQGTKSEFFPEGANAARAVDVPTTDAQGNPIRKTASTAMGAKAIPDNVVLDIQNMVMNGGLSYQVATDKAATTKAISNIKADGFQRSLQQFSDAVQKGVVGVLKTDTPEGQK